ncbi:MAG: radical SAM protein, partial [Verrucomicrobiota bacterium]
MKELKETTSRCPVCTARIPASVESRVSGDREQVWLKKKCPEHGAFESLLSSDARFYWLSTGAREGACCSGVDDICAKPALGDQIGFLGRNARL